MSNMFTHQYGVILKEVESSLDRYNNRTRPWPTRVFIGSFERWTQKGKFIRNLKLFKVLYEKIEKKLKIYEELQDIRTLYLIISFKNQLEVCLFKLAQFGYIFDIENYCRESVIGLSQPANERSTCNNTRYHDKYDSAPRLLISKPLCEEESSSLLDSASYGSSEYYSFPSSIFSYRRRHAAVDSLEGHPARAMKEKGVIQCIIAAVL